MVNAADPKAVHSGALPEARPIAIARKPWTCPTCHGAERSDGTYAQPPADPTLAARERLGAWLSAEPGRSWDRIGDPPDSRVELYDYIDPNERGPSGTLVASGAGQDLASAILAALDAANGGDRG